MHGASTSLVAYKHFFRDLCFFFCRCAVLSAGVGLCEPLAWTMHQPFGSIWLEIFVSAMPRDLKQLAKNPDLVEQYVTAFGKEEKLKKAHAHTHTYLHFAFGQTCNIL